MSNAAAGEETDKRAYGLIHTHTQGHARVVIGGGHVGRRGRRKEGKSSGHSLAGEYTEFEIYPGRTNY